MISKDEILAMNAEHQDARMFVRAMKTELRADDKRFLGTVIMRHADGSQATWVSAFVHEYSDNFLLVFTEHHGYHIYPRDEVELQYQPWKVTPLEEGVEVHGDRWKMKDY